MLDGMQEKGAAVVFIEKFKKKLSYQKWTQNEMFFKFILRFRVLNVEPKSWSKLVRNCQPAAPAS